MKRHLITATPKASVTGSAVSIFGAIDAHAWQDESFGASAGGGYVMRSHVEGTDRGATGSALD
jgi:hypothetical protein